MSNKIKVTLVQTGGIELHDKSIGHMKPENIKIVKSEE